MGGGSGRQLSTDIEVEGKQREAITWVDTLENENGHSEPASSLQKQKPRPFSILSWNILAQSLYEAQYQRRRIAQVALSSGDINSSSQQQQLLTPTSSPHPHPWPKRIKRILQIIQHSQSDIICLQECELHSYKSDIVPALHTMGYDGIAQEDDRLPTNKYEMPTKLKEITKHRDKRNHIVATFWKRSKFDVVGDALVRTRTLTTVLREKKISYPISSDDNDNNAIGEHANDEEEHNDAPNDGDGDDTTNSQNNNEDTITQLQLPTVAVINVHLEGHPQRFSERTHQLSHAMKDLVKTIEHEKKKGGVSSELKSSSDDDQSTTTTTRSNNHQIGKVNALILAGDFNCELQSSACSTYLRMGRLGKQAALGGLCGEDALILPPTLLESTEATSILHPIIEWGRALPEETIDNLKVTPHPFRRNGMMSCYPEWLGRDDAKEHFTFCSEQSKHPVPGLDQIWYSSMTLDRMNLRRMFVDNLTGIWERYFYNNEEVEKRREEERMKVLACGLPSLECDYPSDHLPIGATFAWRLDDECDDESYLLDDHDDETGSSDASSSSDSSSSKSQHCVEEVRELNVVNEEGTNVQDDSCLSDAEQQTQPTFDNPQEELNYLLQSCPYDNDEQKSDIQFILSDLNPPISLTSKERPSPTQMQQLEERRERKSNILKTSSLGVRPWLKNIWTANKRVNKMLRHEMILEERRKSLS